MNHVRISLGQYLWGAHFVAIPSIMLLLAGWGQLLVAWLFQHAGLLRTPSASELNQMACDLVLESSLSIQFQMRRQDEQGNEVGSFIWSPFPIMIDDAGDVHPSGRASLFSVDVDLTRRSIVKATLDDERLKAR